MDNTKIQEKDKKGNIIHFKNIETGYEYWADYDIHGNMIHYIDTDNYEWWKEYHRTKEGYRIYFKNNCGIQLIQTTDIHGKVLDIQDNLSKNLPERK